MSNRQTRSPLRDVPPAVDAIRRRLDYSAIVLHLHEVYEPLVA